MKTRTVNDVVSFLSQHNIPAEIVVLPNPMSTATEASRLLGVPLSQVAKSLIFIVDEIPVMALVPGDHLASENKLAALVNGKQAKMAHPDTARRVTGFPVGGIPPFAHETELISLVEQCLLKYPKVYVSAGSPKAMIDISPQSLVLLTDAIVGDIILLEEKS